jgi:hypothetical protein
MREITMSPRVLRYVAGNNDNRFGSVLILLSILALAGCETPRQVVSQKEDNLAAAGFVVQPSNTPERQAMLNRLPPHRFLLRTHGNTVSYVYADPLVCDCLYIGSQQAYNQYRLHIQQQHLADEQEMTAQMYSDAAWDWGGWGPWGPGYGMEYGPGYGW